MSSRRIIANAASADLLATEEIRNVFRPSVVNLWASSATVDDTLGLRLGNTIIMDTGNINVEASADVIDIGRDQLTFNTVVGAGQLSMPAGVVATELQAHISVEPIL